MMKSTKFPRFKVLVQANHVLVIAKGVLVIDSKTEKPNDFKGWS